MLRAIITVLISLMAIGAMPERAAKGQPATRDEHPWGRFEVGAWKQVRLYKETLDAEGNVTSTSTTDTRTTIVEVDEESFQLRINVTVEVAGRRFQAQPRFVKLGWSGQTQEQQVESELVGPDTYELNGQELPCSVWEVTISDGPKQRVSKEWINTKGAPRILMRKETSRDLETSMTLYETRVRVTAIGMPHKVLAELKTCSHVETVHQQNGESTITHEVHCLDVPGGVVSHSSKVLDKNGTIIQRSTLELTDYGMSQPRVAPIMGRQRGLFKGKRHQRRSF